MPASFRRYILVLLALLACLGMPGRALAHAALNSSVPADGGVSATAPRQIELMFREPVSPLALRLIGPDGVGRSLDRFVLKDSTVVIAPPAGLTNGTYALSWRVVSEDGHPVGGTLVFSIGAPSKAGPETGEQVDTSVRLTIWLSRVGFYLGLFLGCGAAASRAWVGPLSGGARRFAAVMTLLGLACLPVALGAQGLDAMGAQLGAIFQPAMLGVSWRDIGEAAAIASFTAGIIGVKWKDFVLHAFDPAQARAVGLRVNLLHYGLLCLISLTIVGALQAVGIILAIAMLIAPGAIAFLLTKTFSTMLILSVVIATTGSFLGVYLSFFIDSAPAPTIVVLLSIVFVLAFIRATRKAARVETSQPA